MTTTLEKPLRSAATAAADRHAEPLEVQLERKLEAARLAADRAKADADALIQAADAERVAHGAVIAPLAQLLAERDTLIAGIAEAERKLTRETEAAELWQADLERWAQTENVGTYGTLLDHATFGRPHAAAAVPILTAIIDRLRARLANAEAAALDYSAKNDLAYRLPAALTGKTL